MEPFRDRNRADQRHQAQGRQLGPRADNGGALHTPLRLDKDQQRERGDHYLDERSRAVARRAFGYLGVALLVPLVVLWLLSGYLLVRAVLTGDGDPARRLVAFLALTIIVLWLAGTVAQLLRPPPKRRSPR